MDRLAAYLISIFIGGFGVWIISIARISEETFVALLLGGAASTAVGIASLANEIQNDRTRNPKTRF
jgi:hypothetical protein